MCALCNEELIQKLNRQEIRTAGMELIFSGEDRQHVLDKIKELIERDSNERTNNK